MKRISMTLEADLLERLDAWMAAHGYENRSEAIRDVLRDRFTSEHVADDDTQPCVATLSYVYDHARRDLPKRLTETQHHDHGVSQATLHLHLDARDCLEVAVLRGAVGDVRALADRLSIERGVRLSRLHVIPLD